MQQTNGLTENQTKSNEYKYLVIRKIISGSSKYFFKITPY